MIVSFLLLFDFYQILSFVSARSPPFYSLPKPWIRINGLYQLRRRLCNRISFALASAFSAAHFSSHSRFYYPIAEWANKLCMVELDLSPRVFTIHSAPALQWDRNRVIHSQIYDDRGQCVRNYGGKSFRDGWRGAQLGRTERPNGAQRNFGFISGIINGIDVI